jgi:hypothetical protein
VKPLSHTKIEKDKEIAIIMPGFSFTAPIVTPEEEKRERANLTRKELQALNNDLYGTQDILPTPAATKSLSRTLSENEANNRVRKAIDGIPLKEKKEYLKAMEQVPHLVESESSPEAYFRCEKGNATVAANRLVRYWKQRQKLFGESRAFLPMNQDGALAADEAALLKGFVTVLPHDQKGRPVVFFDRIRAIPTIVTRASVIRVLWYVLQKTCEDRSTQRTGFVFLKNLHGYDLYTHFDRTLARSEMMLLSECFPASLKAFHICLGSGKWVVELILPVMKQIAGKYIRLHTVCHVGTNAQLLGDLKDYHISPAHVSIFLGGCVTYESHLAWLEGQRALEEIAVLCNNDVDADEESGVCWRCGKVQNLRVAP